MSVTVKTKEEYGLSTVQENFYPSGYYFLSMPQNDREVFYSLLQCMQPKSYFEFGTGRGTSIDTVRAVMPECEIVSMDIRDPRETRKLNAGLGPIDNKASYIICNSHGWKIPALYYGHFDVVLVDGGHNMPCVVADTAKALQIVRPDGMIIWHDLNLDLPDMQPYPYLSKYFPYEVTWIKDTTIGLWVNDPYIKPIGALYE